MFYYILKNNAWIFIGVSRRLVVVWVQEGTVCGGIHSTDCHSIYKRHQLLESRDRTCSLYDPWASKTTCGNLKEGQMIFTINDILKHLPKQFINVLTWRKNLLFQYFWLNTSIYVFWNHLVRSENDTTKTIYSLKSWQWYDICNILLVPNLWNISRFYAGASRQSGHPMSADLDRRR